MTRCAHEFQKQFSHKSSPHDAFDEIHQVLLDGISNDMDLWFEPVKYGAVNNTYTKTNGFYVIMFTSEACKLQDNTTIYGQIITTGELFVKA